MNTLVCKVNEKQLDREVLRRAGALIRAGELVAFPTETVYGLGGDALNPEASCRIYAAKGRPSDNPLIVHIADMEALDRIVKETPAQARQLAAEFWPGPLTMILEKSDAVPPETTGGLPNVAVRMPDHPIALAFIREAGGYIAAPSANTSGRPSPTQASHVYEDLAGKIPMILDGGPVRIGLESTIIDLTEGIPTILRPGFITPDMIRRVTGAVRTDPGLTGQTDDSGAPQHPKAPGMRYRHYAPKADLTIVSGERAAVHREIKRCAEELMAQGKRVGIMTTAEIKQEEDAAGHQPFSNCDIKILGYQNDEASIAQHLYAALREFDADGVDYIFSEEFDTPHMGQAIMNRLLKAAGHKKIKV